MGEPDDQPDDLTHYMESASAYTSLRGELTTIFGVPILREGETWNDAMLRQIGGILAHSHRQAKYIKTLYEGIAVRLDLLIKELGGE